MGESEDLVASGATTTTTTLDGGEQAVSPPAMVGGSLPPRKRLLAGLKQNGSWSATSSPPAAAAVGVAGANSHAMPGGERTDEAQENGGAAPAAASSKSGCVSCGVSQSSASLKRVRRNGLVQRLCSSCALASNKDGTCPHCQAVCPPDVKDPAVWSPCSQCQRVVHLGCEKKSQQQQLPSSPFLCTDCIRSKGGEADLAGAVGAEGGAEHLEGQRGQEGEKMPGSTAEAAECSSPSAKRPRDAKDHRLKSRDVDGAGHRGSLNSSKSGVEPKHETSQEAIAADAAQAAALASRAAAAAKASAIVKAAMAVKAAAAAKAALDAAALAARVEAEARNGWSRRSAGSFERNNSGAPDANFDGPYFPANVEKAEVIAVKVEGEETAGIIGSTSLDDEELARQLHREINSSSRISGSLTPQRRKPARLQVV